MYLVNEIFYSIQGEGYWSGRPAVFVRFSNCNLWTGNEADRPNAICQFCDTTFTEVRYRFHGGVGLADAVRGVGRYAPMVVLTGGEPALQVDRELVEALQDAGFYVAIETNGTLPIPDTIDWVCVSPKTPKLRITTGHELKLVYPQERITPGLFEFLDFDHFWLSPKNNGEYISTINSDLAYQYVLDHPRWRLNLQAHKVIGVR